MPNKNNTTEQIFDQVRGTNTRILLHACCGPCASYVIPFVNTAFSTTVYYFNPCIMPQGEYEKRAENLRIVVANQPQPTELIVESYDVAPYLLAIRGLEEAPECGARCTQCFRLRLEQTAAYAASHGYTWFGTTLSVSPHKNAVLINEIGLQLAAKYGINWLVADFKKKDGYKKSTEIARALGLYRQNYCGCEFSRR